MSLGDARRMLEAQNVAIVRGSLPSPAASLTPNAPQALVDEVSKIAVWAPVVDLSSLKSWAAEWVEYGLRTGPMSSKEWAIWEVGARGCYAALGAEWPGKVVRVPSPTVGSIAAPLAAWWLRNRYRWTADGSCGPAKPRSVRDTAEVVVGHSELDVTVTDDVVAAVQAVIGWRQPFIDLTDDEMDSSPPFMHFTRVLPLPHGMKQIEDRIDDTLKAAVRPDLLNVVHKALASIDREIDVVNRPFRWRDLNACKGRFGAGKHAEWSFFRDVAKADLDHEAWEFSRVLQAAQSAGTWWPFPEVVMVSELPAQIHVEALPAAAQTAWDAGIRRKQLHCETGPAVAWPDRRGVYSWHGVIVPWWVIEQPSVERAMNLDNSEQRRAAFEVIGWDRVIASLDVAPLDRCPDPGNAPHELLLYELPPAVSPFRRPVNLLLMTNGSPDRSGALRQYGETVPAEIGSALDAAAWQYGVSPKVYAQIARRT